MSDQQLSKAVEDACRAHWPTWDRMRPDHQRKWREKMRASVANTFEIIAVMEKALWDIDDYSADSTVQPVQVARAALEKLWGPNWRQLRKPPK